MPPTPAIDHLAVVTAARQKWDQMTAGPARAWTIVNETALQLQARGEDAGLLEKTSGNQYLGFSTDRLLYRTGELFDILGNSEGEATPQWMFEGQVAPTLWRPPLGDVPPPPTDPGSPPLPGECDECSLLQTMVEALVGLRDDLAVVKSELASANEQRQVIISELARVLSRLEVTPTMEQLTKNPVLVKFRW